MTKAELLIQRILATKLGIDDSEIKLHHIQHFCRNADERDILRYRGIGPVSLAALRGKKPPKIPPDDPLIGRIDQALKKPPIPERTRTYSTAFLAIRRRLAELRDIVEDAVTNEDIVAHVKSMPDRELVRIEGVGSDVERVRAELENWPDKPALPRTPRS